MPPEIRQWARSDANAAIVSTLQNASHLQSRAWSGEIFIDSAIIPPPVRTARLLAQRILCLARGKLQGCDAEDRCMDQIWHIAAENAGWVLRPTV